MGNKVDVRVYCRNPECRRSFFRTIDSKFVREDGSVTVTSYCRDCLKKTKKGKRGHSYDKIKELRTDVESGVRVLSRSEINRIAPTLTPPNKVKKTYLRTD